MYLRVVGIPRVYNGGYVYPRVYNGGYVYPRVYLRVYLSEG